MSFFRFLIIFIFFQNFCFSDEINPPKAKKIQIEDELINANSIDEYSWMESFDDNEVLKYVDDENLYTEKSNVHLKKFKKFLFDEMKSHIVDNKIPIIQYTYGNVFFTPFVINNHEYYQKFYPEYSFPFIMKRSSNSEKVLLNLNDFSKEMDNFNLATFKVDPNEKFLAFTYDPDGSMSYHLVIKDLSKNAFLSDHIKDTAEDIIWSKDGKAIFYLKMKDSMPYMLKKHLLGSSASEDIIIYEEKDNHLCLNITASSDNSLILINSYGQDYSETRFLLNDNASVDPILIIPKEIHVKYIAEKADDNSFFILTNEDAINFKIERYFYEMKKKILVLPQNDNEFIEKIVPFKNYLVLQIRKNANPQIKILNLENENAYKEKIFDEAIYNLQLEKGDFNKNVLRYVFSSPLTPAKIVDLDLKTLNEKIYAQEKPIKWFDSSKYITKKIFATSYDGKKIPISLFYKKDISYPAPVYLKSYGAYGDSFDLSFSEDIFSLIDRGVIFAIAHVRGGSEFGPVWYNDGKILKKKNTFFDFISSLKYLIQNKYTTANNLVISGKSAGGLIMGVVLNWEPKLIKAAILEVPFLGSTIDSKIPNSWDDYENYEWGNPKIKEELTYLLSYLPYQNIKRQNYPNVLVLTAMHDSIIPFYEPMKWVAKLRDLKTDNNKVFLNIDKSKGHKNKSNIKDKLNYLSFLYAYILNQMNLNDFKNENEIQKNVLEIKK